MRIQLNNIHEQRFEFVTINNVSKRHGLLTLKYQSLQNIHCSLLIYHIKILLQCRICKICYESDRG